MQKGTEKDARLSVKLTVGELSQTTATSSEEDFLERGNKGNLPLEPAMISVYVLFIIFSTCYEF
jgi:hypothetical protein